MEDFLSTENLKFEYKGKTYSRDHLAKEAKKHNMDVGDYIDILVGRGMKQIGDSTKAPVDDESVFGFFEDLVTSWDQGWLTGSSVDEAFDVYKKGATLTDEELQDYIDAATAMNNAGSTNEQFMYQKAVEENGGGFFGGMKALYENPGFAPQALVTSLATMIGSFADSDEVAGYALAGAGTGAAVGGGTGAALTSWSGPGALFGAGAGAITGATAGGFGALTGAMETGLTLTELLKVELGEKEFNKENIRAILEDEEAITRIKNRSLARGLTIGAIEGLTAGLSRGVGSRMLTSSTTTGLKTGSKIAATTTGIEMVGGSGGELLGQIAAGQEIKGDEIFLEGILESKGVFNTSDIIKAAVTKTEYNINGETRTEQDVVNILNDENLTDEEVSNIRINIVGNPILEAKVKNKQRKSSIGKNIDETITDSKDRQTLIDLELERLVLEQNNSKKGVFKKVNNDAKIEENQKKIDDVIGKYEGVDITKLQEQTKTSVEQFNISESIAFAETEGKRIGKDVIVVDNDISAQESYDKIIAEKGGKAKDVTGADGFIIGDSIVINKEVAGKSGQINVGGHELLHGVIAKHLKSLVKFDDNGNVVGVDGRINFIKQFKNTISKKSRNYIEAEINRRNKGKNGEGLDINTTDEWLTIYSDGLKKGDLTFNEGVFTKLRNVLHDVFRAFGYNKEFGSGIATYNFMKDYQGSLQSGKLTDRAVKVAGGGTTVTEGKLSRSKAVDAVNEMEQGATTKAEFQKPGIFNNIYNSITQKNGAINNYVKSLGLSKEKFQETIDSLGDRLMNYDPAAQRKAKGGEPVTIGEFLMANVGFAKLDAAKKLAIEGKRQSQEQSTDIGATTKEGDVKMQVEDTDTSAQEALDEQDMSVEGIAKTKQDKAKAKEKQYSKFRKQLGIETGSDLYNKVIETAKKALLRAYEVGTSVRNIQRKLRDEASVYLFKDIKNFLGTKDYIKNITEYREFIVNAIFTADLVQLEKMVPESERVFTVFDRELTSKADVEAAVEQNLLPKEALKVIDKGNSVRLYRKTMPTSAKFVKFFNQPGINPDTGQRSGLKGTRKDALAKAMAGALSFDATMEVAQDPEVAQMRKDIAELNNETLAKDDIQQLASIIGREVNVKFSNSAKKEFTARQEKLMAVGGKIIIDLDKAQIIFDKISKDIDQIPILQNLSEKESEKYGGKFLINSVIDAFDTRSVERIDNSLLVKYIKENIERGQRVSTVYEQFFISLAQNVIKNLDVSIKTNLVVREGNIPDVYFQSNNKSIGLEIKMDQSRGVSYTWRFDGTSTNPNSINVEEQSELIEEVKTEAKKLPGITEDDLKSGIKESQYNTLRINKSLFNRTKNVLAAYLEEHYTGKVNPEYFINIGEAGLYYMLPQNTKENFEIIQTINSIANELKIPRLTGTFQLNTVMNIGRPRKTKNYTRAVTIRVQPRIDSNSKNFSKKSNLNLSNKADMQSFVNVVSKNLTVFSKTEAINNVDNVMKQSRSVNNPTKGITILDFDDTLATSSSLIKFTRPDDTKGTLTPEQYASTYEDLLGLGYEFDFSEFNKVVDGKPAPLLNKAKKLAGKFGTDNMFILTARPQESAVAIQKFLKENGLDIPLKNITGLGNSTSEAKALWVLDKAAEGYNDFYFADDAIQNVQAVQNMLDQIDVKSKVQQARVKFSKSMNEDFNNILEDVSGIDSIKRFSEAKGKRRGKSKGKFRYFVPPSHEDFIGLLYNFMGKGKKGNEHRSFFEQALVRPLNRAYRELNAAKQAIANDYRALIKGMPIVSKKLGKKILDGDFTNEDAIRVYLWDKFGFKIPGLSETDQKKLSDFVKNDPMLQSFSDMIGNISKDKEGYVKPSDNWDMGGIKYDLIDATGRIGRARFFQEFIENADIIFSKENINKIEAIYGADFRSALEDMLYRVKNGTNRPTGANKMVNGWMDWINGSIGATMFFNARSALLQQLSFVNFMNFSDNNIFKSAARFANQKQFWSDFAMIFNSDYLKQRRTGAGFDVNASEIAREVSGAVNPARAAIRYLLNLGFLPTQMGDSFAIAIGGASFYRNRVATYLKEGLSQKEAEGKAFIDFQQIAEATQQSARPDMISQQQASVLGRFVLAFQNVTSQYARIVKKSTADIVKRRVSPGYKTQGKSDMANVSRIMYYGAVQSVVFYGLQTALFAMMFDDDEKDEEFFDKKKDRIINGTIDSLLRGAGVLGAVISTVKNYVIKVVENSKSDSYFKTEAWLELLSISPPVSIKQRKIAGGERTANWNKDVIKEMETMDIDNPLWDAVTSTTEGLTNVPLNRLYKKVQNLRAAQDSENAWWQRVAVALGWSKWDVGIENKEIDEVKKKIKKDKSNKKKTKEDKKEESINIEKQKQEKKDGKKDIKCAATSKSGNRCKTTVEPGQSYCTIHEKVTQNKSGKKSQCKKIKKDKNRCGMQTNSKSGYCYYHD